METANVKVNKSALIRKYLNETQYTSMGPSELAKVIMAEHSGVQIATSEISNVKTKLLGGGQKPTMPVSMGTLVDNLTAFKSAVDAVGGKEAASQLLKMLN